MKNPFFTIFLFSFFVFETKGQPCNNYLQVNAAKSGCRIGDLDIVGNTLTVEANFNRTLAYDTTYQGGDIVSKHQDPTNVNYLLRPNVAAITTTKVFLRFVLIAMLSLIKLIMLPWFMTERL